MRRELPRHVFRIQDVGVLSLLILVAGLLALTAQQKTPPGKRAASEPPASSIQKLFKQDQKDREHAMSATAEQWASVRVRDAERRRLVREMLESEVLETGEDFKDASFIFQHGDRPQDYLLAHILAVAAISKGDTSARWIAAATLDRYLQSINQPQAFGTQYHLIDPRASPRSSTQAPYEKNLLPDALRKDFCVPSSIDQQQNVDALNQGKELGITNICR